jgi:hypothetical protein
MKCAILRPNQICNGSSYFYQSMFFHDHRSPLVPTATFTLTIVKKIASGSATANYENNVCQSGMVNPSLICGASALDLFKQMIEPQKYCITLAGFFLNLIFTKYQGRLFFPTAQEVQSTRLEALTMSHDLFCRCSPRNER